MWWEREGRGKGGLGDQYFILFYILQKCDQIQIEGPNKRCAPLQTHIFGSKGDFMSNIVSGFLYHLTFFLRSRNV
jgi:hypothetical protein